MLAVAVLLAPKAHGEAAKAPPAGQPIQVITTVAPPAPQAKPSQVFIQTNVMPRRTAEDECIPAVNDSDPTSWTLTDRCNDPKMLGVLQALVNLQRKAMREQSSRYPRLGQLEQYNDHLLMQLTELKRTVQTVRNFVTPGDVVPGGNRAAQALEQGDPLPAIELLGKMSNGPATAQVMRQQASLLRLVDLARALETYEKLAKPSENDYAVLRNCGDLAYFMGNLAQSLLWHQKLETWLRQSSLAAPENASLQSALLTQYDMIASLEYEAGHKETAIENWNRAILILEKQLATTPEHVRRQLRLAALHARKGISLGQLGRDKEALVAQSNALAIRQKLLQTAPASTARQNDVVNSLVNLGEVHIRLEQYAEALETYRNALALQQQMQPTPVSTLMADIANSHSRIGELHGLLKHAPADAMTSFQAALSLQLKLVAGQGSNTNWQRDLAITHHFIADLQRKQQQYRDAMASYQAALMIERKLIEQDASVNQWQHDMANTLSRIAELQKLQDQKTAALASYRTELAIRQRLHAKTPDNLLWQHELAANQDAIGETLTLLGQYEEALKPYQAALALRQKLPGDETVIKLRMQAASWAKLAAAQYRLGQWEASLQSNEAELGLRRKVLQLAPDEPAWQRELALMGLFIGDLQQILNHPEEALRQYRDAVSQLGRLAGTSPAPEAKQSELAVSHGKIGKLLQKMDNFPAANEAFQAALAISRPLAAKHPENHEMQSSLAADLSYLANLAFQQGQIADALKNYQSSLSILVKLNLAEPKQVRWKNYMATLYMRIGDCQTALGSDIDALSNYNAALVWQQQVSSELPGAEAQVDLCNNHVRIGDMQARLGYTDATLQSFQTAQAILQPVLAREPGSASLQRSMSTILLRLGDALGDMKNFATAESHMQQAMQMRQKLAQATPQDGQLQINVATVYASLGMVQEAQNHPEQAIAQFRLAQVISDQLVAKEPKNVQWQLASAGFAGRIASVDGSSLSLPARKDLLQESIRRIKRLQGQQTLPGWASNQLSQLEKKLDDLNHPERARATAAATATATASASSPGSDVTPGNGSNKNGGESGDNDGNNKPAPPAAPR